MNYTQEEEEKERQSTIQNALYTIEGEHILKNGQLEEFPDWESTIDLSSCEELLSKEEEEEEAQKEDTVLDDDDGGSNYDLFVASTDPSSTIMFTKYVNEPLILQKNIGITVPTFDHAMTQDDVHTVRNILSDHLVALFSDATIARCFFKNDYFNLFENKYVAYEDDEVSSGYHITFKLQPFEMPINKKN